MLKKLAKFMTRKTLSNVLLINAVALGCVFSNAANAISYNQISQVIFFGDSLTDSGYNDLITPTLPVGKAPTFTTYGGYTYAQYLARDIKGVVLPIYPGPTPPDKITNNSETPAIGGSSGTLKGFDYAAAGSTTNGPGNGEAAPSLVTQVNFYLDNSGQQADPDALYFIFSGANDILALLSITSPPTQLQLLQASATAATNIANQAARLSAAGAKRIVVMALPNLGVTPLISAEAVGNPALPSQLTSVTFTFDSMLNTALGKVIAQYGVKILYIDVYNLLDNLITTTNAGQPYVVAGQSFQFVNATNAACGDPRSVSALFCPSTAPTAYVFADGIHPADMAHHVLALQIETQIQAWT
jgi:outer membrane lipase/esterase